MLVFSGSSNLSLAKKLADGLGLRLGKIELSRFADDEARVWVREKKVGREVVVIQSLSQPSDHHLVEFSLICDALRRMGVRNITAVIPWLGYSRQDKVFRQGEPLSVEVVAKILQLAQLKKVITFDLHNPAIKRFFRVEVVNLSARSLLVEYFKPMASKDMVIVAPDAGAVTSSSLLAKELGVRLVVVDKYRDLATGKIIIKGMKGEVKNKQVIILDDMIVGGGTLIKASQWLKQKGAREVLVGVTHHLQIPGVQKKLEENFVKLVVATDTIESRVRSNKLKIVSVADMLAEAIGG